MLIYNFINVSCIIFSLEALHIGCLISKCFKSLNALFLTFQIEKGKLRFLGLLQLLLLFNILHYFLGV